MGQQHATPSRISLRPSDQPVQPSQLFRTPGQSQSELERLEEPGELVPVMFKWTHGGQRVALTGTFNNWASAGIPMVRSGQEFYQVVEIPKGVHEYKFLVDGEWKFSLDQPVLEDTGGNVNNVVDIQYYEKYEPTPLRDPVILEDQVFGTEILDPNQSEPSSVPPLLMKLPLLGISASRTQQPLFLEDPTTTAAPNIPLFSISGHIISDGDMVATTIRFAQKYSSTVLVRKPKLSLTTVLGGVSRAPSPQLADGILRRANSSGSEGRSKLLDLSTFTD